MSKVIDYTPFLSLYQFVPSYERIFAIVNAEHKQLGIGYAGNLLTTNDLAFFKRQTANCDLLFGSKTWQGFSGQIRKSLCSNNRTCFVASQRTVWRYDLALDHAVLASTSDKASNTLAICGGSALLTDLLDYCDEVFLTKTYLKHDMSIDAFMAKDLLVADFALTNSCAKVRTAKDSTYVHEYWTRQCWSQYV